MIKKSIFNSLLVSLVFFETVELRWKISSDGLLRQKTNQIAGKVLSASQ